jgi:hypothetical protein
VSGYTKKPNGYNGHTGYTQKRRLPEGMRHRCRRCNRCQGTAYASALTALERHCPDKVDELRWRQALDDARQFLDKWAEEAKALGWSDDDLLGLLCRALLLL